MRNQIAWAAGLFEGEGTISLTQNRRYRNPRPQLMVQMVDFDVIRKFKKIVRVGNVSHRKRKTKSGKRVLVWSTSCKADIRLLLRLFIPYFGIRRKRRAMKVLKFTNYLNKGWGHALGH